MKLPDDIVIISAVRTPIGKGKKGAFRDVEPELLLSSVLKGVCERGKIPPSMVDDVVVGTVLTPAGGATISRMAMFHAGFPERTTVSTVNRQCSSGLQALASVAAAIRAGYITIGIGAGVESMSINYGPVSMPLSINDQVSQISSAADCMIPMGITSENVAELFSVTRQKQDRFAALSHQKAYFAQKNGLFDEEIVPVSITTTKSTHTTNDSNNNNKGEKATHSPTQMIITKDEGIRDGMTEFSLATLKPSFKENGSTTPGNSSQVSDGAAAVLLMKRSTAERLGLSILAKFVDFAVVGVPPHIMGIGPAVAIPQLLKRANLPIEMIDIFEINEAFASQAVYSIESLKIPLEKVNPKGGAIALGHPLGCTGARQIATLLPEMRRQKAALGVVSMCIGSGMGAAALIENEAEVISSGSNKKNPKSKL